MPLTLRRAASFNPPGSPQLFQGEDWRVLQDGRYIGRIYRTHNGRWSWAVSAHIEASRHSGLADTRQTAMAAFKAAVGTEEEPQAPSDA